MAQSQSWWEPLATPPPPDGQSPNLEFEQMDPEALPDAGEELLTRRVHLLGTGSIGTLVAHALKLLPNPPPVSILMHRRELYDDFQSGRRIVRLVNKNTDINDEQTGYDVDVREQTEDGKLVWRHFPAWKPNSREEVSPVTDAERLPSGETFIYTLIVTVKGPATVEALKSVKHRVDARTTVLLMQNGMGQIDLLNKKVFTDPSTRPTYMLGIISHGCHMQGPFAVVHAGFGTVALGIHRDLDRHPLPPKGQETPPLNLPSHERRTLYPSDNDLYSNLSSRYLLRTLTRSTELACAAYPYLDLLQLQLEKLVANCLINPLTALFDVPNAAILDNQPLTRIQRLLIAEIAFVIRSMPELEGIPNVRTRFSASRLEAFSLQITKKTGKNSSSMREDIRHVRKTEIDYINGYIVKRGEELGIKCVLNYMIVNLIKAKDELLLKSGLHSIPRDTATQTSTQEGDTVVLGELEGRAAEADMNEEQLLVHRADGSGETARSSRINRAQESFAQKNR